ncbi:MAG: 16S rRNA (guanine(527)-N(7))-methyltransferase RsmG [Bacteroidales bacterium]|nr:16S rRNA (guanine(527)-N(7))-methyltransferase RsmG [Bacteroidales bacterium]
MNMEAAVINHYFPQLDRTARSRFAMLGDLYAYWNQKINVISRKDMEHLYIRHVLHSLSLSRTPSRQSFLPGMTVLDAGTGGGFPGIPLAILHPNVEFVLCDSIAKKIKVVSEITRELGLSNVTPLVSRLETLPGHAYNVIVSRAVTRLETFIPWTRDKLMDNGKMLFVKGGDLKEEIGEASRKCGIPLSCFSVTDLKDLFPGLEDDFFETKKICEIKQTSYLCAPPLESS